MNASAAMACLAALALTGQAPPPDYDKDGIPNVDDDCPTDPGVASNKGCPGEPPPAPPPAEVAPTEPSLAHVAGSVIRLDRPILFASGSARLKRSNADLIAAITKAIKSLPSNRHIIVRGHTDSTGKRLVNLRLSKRRAAAVVDALVAQAIDRNRLRPDGVGPDVPIASNKSPEGRAKNRRVEFVIVDADHGP